MDKRPIDITILATLAIIGGMGCVLLSLLMIPKIITPSWWGFAYPIYAVFLFTIAYGFLKAKNWARIAFLLLVLIGAISYLWQGMREPIAIIIPIISSVVIIYVLTRPNVKSYFGKK